MFTVNMCQEQEAAAPSVVGLSSWDGGVTWLSSVKSDCVITMSLVISSALSILPVTNAMSPEISYLSEDITGYTASHDHDGDAAVGAAVDGVDGVDKLRPIMEVFEAQPFHSDGKRQKGWTGSGLMVLIVISRDVPRPTQVCFMSTPLCDGHMTYITYINQYIVLTTSLGCIYLISDS